MIGELRRGLRIDRVRKLQDRLQALGSEGDRMLLAPPRTPYVEGSDAMLAKDLFELIEKAIDKCRDVGNIVYSPVLKNSRGRRRDRAQSASRNLVDAASPSSRLGRERHMSVVIAVVSIALLFTYIKGFHELPTWSPPGGLCRWPPVST